MGDSALQFIRNRDLFGPTVNTPYKDRDNAERTAIVLYINGCLRTKCDSLHYDGDLKDVLSVVEKAIRSKIEDVIDEAKLEMYK